MRYLKGYLSSEKPRLRDHFGSVSKRGTESVPKFGDSSQTEYTVGSIYDYHAYTKLPDNTLAVPHDIVLSCFGYN